MNNSPETNRFALLIYAILMLVSFALALHPLIDFDLGWHLAGGLWMLDHHAVPTADPLGAEQHLWVAYSWLPEILFAILFRLGGFTALLWLQTLLSVSSALSFSIMLRRILQSDLRTNGRRQLLNSEELSWAVGSFIVLIFLVPIWHLRPQLMSLILFSIALALAERGALSLWKTVMLGVLWANIHVYWIFLPVIVSLYAVVEPAIGRRWTQMQSGVVLFVCAVLAGAINPYGLQAFQVLWSYAFAHQAATVMVHEFKHLTPEFGFIFWVFITIIVVLIANARKILSTERPATIGLLLIVTAAFLLQVKYGALFGIVAILVLSRRVLPDLLGVLRIKPAAEDVSKLSGRFAATLGGVLLAVALLLTNLPTALPPDWSDLLALTTTLGPELCQTTNCPTSDNECAANLPAVVLNHFDDGGWLELGFYLAKPEPATAPICRAAIDGRTLVVGAVRLEEFDRLRRLSSDWCQIINKWGGDTAFLRRGRRLTEALLSVADTENLECGRSWRIVSERGEWVVLQSRAFR